MNEDGKLGTTRRCAWVTHAIRAHQAPGKGRGVQSPTNHFLAHRLPTSTFPPQNQNPSKHPQPPSVCVPSDSSQRTHMHGFLVGGNPSDQEV